MDNYKNKYLKYKNKYLDLKTRLIGGADCPTLGFYQHSGECWHDSLSMILLYSNGLSENIQAMFNSEHFSAEECIQQAIGNPQLDFLLPKNIEPENYGQFMDYAKEYISQLQSRYLNDKLPIKPYTKIEPEDSKLFRQNSIKETMECTNMIFNIANINLNESHKRNNTYGGNIWHEITVISLFNYFLLNYLPEQLGPVRELKFINMYISTINPFRLFYTKDQIHKLIRTDKIRVINKILEEIKLLKTKLRNCIGIYVSLRNRFELDINDTRTQYTRTQLVGHAVGFIKCNDKLFFYDDNGVLEGEPIVGVNPSVEVNPSVALNIDVVEFRNTAPTLLIEFDWINYLKKKISEVIPRLEHLKYLLEDPQYLEDPVESSHILEVILRFSKFIYTYGRKYLKEKYIFDFRIITLEKLSTPEDYNEEIEDINFIYKECYRNPRSK